MHPYEQCVVILCLEYNGIYVEWNTKRRRKAIS
jgi:hypothetical protein